MTELRHNVLGLVEIANEESDDIRSQAKNDELHSAFCDRLNDWIRPKDEFSFIKKNRATESPLLVFVHLRGGHAPFDISKDVARELPPAEYGGDLSPRRAAIQVAEVRTRSHPARRRIPEEDWVRLGAMRKAALPTGLKLS